MPVHFIVEKTPEPPPPAGKILFAFGSNEYGQTGTGAPIGYGNNILSPTQVGSLTDWELVASGEAISAAIKSDGTLWTWGYNAFGQLGLGDTDTRSSPTQVGSLTDWDIVDCGGTHITAIKTDGTLWACGLNNLGQLGFGTSVDLYSSPVQVGSLTDWDTLATGAYHVLALKTDGTIWTWGAGSNGQLGLGDTDNRSSPVQIGSDTDWVKVGCGSYHSFGIKSDGSLFAWGRNVTYGELGLGDTANKSSPVQVGSLTDWASATGGAYFSVFLKTDGTLWTVGRNNSGQLGHSTTAQNYSSPVQVGALTDWQSIACTNASVAAVKTDGTLWTWGEDNRGQLGNGVDFPDESSPIQVGSLTNWESVACGNESVLALQTS